MVERLLEGFKKLLEHRDCNNILSQGSLKENIPSEKCSKISSEIRQEGNKIFRNHSHNERSHQAILSLYSKSIALAPIPSEELAMAYGNRSALLLHLKKYKECLIDIERAHQITNSDEFKIKLQDRKIKCLSSMDASLKSGKNIQQNESSKIKNANDKKKLDVKFVASKRISCASESVSLRYNEEYGRHVIATKNIKPGEIIAVEEKCIFVPMPDKKYSVCTNCLNIAWTGLPSESCTVVIFCSEKCKAEAWQQYHDTESSILHYLYSLDNSFIKNDNIIVSFISAVRLFIRAVKEEGLETIINDIKCLNSNSDMHLNGFFHEGVFQSNKFRSIYNLSCPSKKETLGDITISSAITNLLCKTNLLKNKMNANDSTNSDETMYSLIRDCLFKLKRIMNSNSWQIEDTEGDHNYDYNNIKGLVMAQFSSLVNHSCYPNAKKVITRSGKFILHALRPIAKGSQIYDTYGPLLTQDKCTRQKFLQENFFFTCKCMACTENWPSLDVSSLSSVTSKIEIVSNSMMAFYEYIQRRVPNTNLSVHEWPVDKKTLKRVSTLIELIHKHHNGHKALTLDLYFVSFIEYAFLKSFGLD